MPGVIAAMREGKKSLTNLEKQPDCFPRQFNWVGVDKLLGYRLLRWRFDIARYEDIKPTQVMSDFDLKSLVQKHQTIKSKDDFDAFVARMANPSEHVKKQKKIIYAHFTDDQEFLEKIRNLPCNQCGLHGHTARQCTGEPDKEKCKELKRRFYAQNAEQKAKQMEGK